MAVKAVFFDAGETLIYRNPPLAYIAYRVLFAAGYRRSPAKIDRAFFEGAAELKEIVRKGEASDSKKWYIYIKKVLGKLGIHDPALAAVLKEKLKKGTSFRSYADVSHIMTFLKLKKIKTGIISNAPADLAGILKRTGIYSLVKNIIISENTGFEKPDKRIFLKALKETGVKNPGDAVYVGDNFIADVEGALNAGMVPVWLKRRSKCAHFSYGKNDPGIKVRTIRNLRELSVLMEKEGWV